MVSTILPLATGYRNGYGNISFLESNSQEGALRTSPFTTWAKRTWKIAKVTYKANNLTGAFDQPNIYKTQLVVAAVALSVLNYFSAGAVYERRESRVAAAIWKYTPALIVITNVALLALEVYTIPIKVAASAFAMAFTCVAPETAQNIVLPAQIVSFVFGDNLTRVIIAVEAVAQFVTKS